MKRWMVIFLAMTLAVSAAGCSSGTVSSSSQASSSSEVSSEASSEASSSEASSQSSSEESAPELQVPKIDADPALQEQVKAAYEGTGEFSKQPTAVIETDMGSITIRLFPQFAPKAVENFTTHAKNGYYDGLTFHRVIEDFMIQGGDPAGNGTGGESIWKAPFEDEFTDVLHNFRGALSMANSGANTNGSQFFIVQNKTPYTEAEWYQAAVNAFMNPKVQEAQMKIYAARAEGKSEEELQKMAEELSANLDNQMAGQELQDFLKRMAAAREQYGKVGGTPHLDQNHTVFGYVSEGMDVVDKIAAVEKDASDKPKTDVKIIKITVS